MSGLLGQRGSRKSKFKLKSSPPLTRMFPQWIPFDVKKSFPLYSWLSEHGPLMLCDPPGSSKTMTLLSGLRKLPDREVVGLNFFSATSPELILKTFK